MNANDPAYPIVGEEQSPVHIDYGLTKREAFAMAAMQGLLAGSRINPGGSAWRAAQAVEHADALIAALGGGR